MSLVILTDEQIKDLLESMTVDELEGFYMDLRSALHDYSVGAQPDEEDLDIHQPQRIVVNSSRTGAKTLFMPSSSPVGLGVKVMTLTPPHTEASPPPAVSSPTDPDTTIIPKRRSTTSSNDKPQISPTGAVTLFSPTGAPIGILHARTLTAFRTALASACLVVKRNKVHTVTVFGSGEQAYWHIRLALMLRGSTIRHVNIINRRFSDNARRILQRLYGVPAPVKAREGWTEAKIGLLTPGYGEFSRLLREQVRAADVIFCCTPSREPLFDHAILTSGEGRRKGRLVVAVGSYTPDMIEVPVEVLHMAVRTHESGRMHFHKHAVEGGVVIVDTLDGALVEAGEIMQGGLRPNQLIELGELVMLQRIKMDEESSSDTNSFVSSEDSSSIPPHTPELDKLDKLDLSSGPSMSTIFRESEDGGSRPGSRPNSRPASPVRNGSLTSSIFRHGRKSSQGGGSSSISSSDRKKKEREDHMCRWLQAGNVIYKSVGLGLMDLTVGMRVVVFAKQKGVGTHVEGF